VLDSLPAQDHPDLLIGVDQRDDCGVLRVSDEKAIILTVDFFPAIVDDPYSFGQVTAANALGDIYAMGGSPLSALNIIGFPEGDLPVEALELLLKGGADKVGEAGAIIAGGHMIKDTELKYGLSVVGTVHPDRIIRTAGARPGDRLILTKPIGTGIYSTALKNGAIGDEEEERYIEIMSTLNDVAGGMLYDVGARACTDVTGFGLIGHALEMATASNVTLALDFEAVPVFPKALEFAAGGFLTGGGTANMEHARGEVGIDGDLLREEEMLLYDAQTSGGLLISVPGGVAEDFVRELRSAGVEFACVIGEVLPESEKRIVVRK
jgi:selenide,water dikinase